MKNWSLGYEIIRIYVRFAFWLTHKRIVVTGQNIIPEGKPIIFAPNHQNALMDPLAVACTNKHQSVWLARADIFKSKTAKSFLNYIKMLPVYRIRDGKDNLSNNELIFSQVIEVLENKQTIALFPEAAHSGIRQMLPHKKAIPRIALEAEEKNKFDLGLQIVPVGIFYNHYWAFKRSLIVQYGEPISIDKYKTEYTENPQKAMLSLRDEIHDQLRPLTMEISSEKHYQDYENMRQLAGKSYSKAHLLCKKPDLQLFYAEKELIGKLELLENKQPEIFEKLIRETSGYFDTLKKAGLSDDKIRKAGEARWTLFLVQLLTVFLSLPIFAFGFVFNAVPFFLPRMILHRKVKNITFLSTFNFAVGLIVFPLFYLFCASLLFIMTGSWVISIVIFILIPFGGKVAFQLLSFYRDSLFKLTYLAGNKLRHNTIKKLLNQRNKQINLIIEKVNF